MPTSQFPTLGTGLIVSYQCHDGISKDDCLNCKMLMVLCENLVSIKMYIILF